MVTGLLPKAPIRPIIRWRGLPFGMGKRVSSIGYLPIGIVMVPISASRITIL